MQPTRRQILSIAASVPASGLLFSASKLPPVRTITKGPEHHWFGYYDKLQFDPASRRVLSMAVNFEHRSPRADDVIRVGMIDTGDGDRWLELGTSSAWGWQQGCMLQWIPGSPSGILWNDREAGQYVCRVLDTETGRRRTLPAPIYALSPDGQWAVTTDFRRLNDTRPGYGYGGIPDPNADVLAPEDAGLWRVDLNTGKKRLIFSYAQAAAIPFQAPEGVDVSRAQRSLNLSTAKHWFNHLLVSPDGSRFIFLHRWRTEGDQRYLTRMFTINADGTDPFVIDPYGQTSHFIWRDPKSVLAWAWHPSHQSGFYLYTDRSDAVDLVGGGVMTQNGHCTYLPGNQWILNDTYPDKKKREQHVYLYEVASGKRTPLGDFHSPAAYTGEWRCDTHPRFSPDGKKVCIDSPHAGDGRQLHLIDVSGAVG
jgi:hypothetical protein